MAQIDVNLRDIYRVVRKRKWFVLFSPIVMGIATYMLTQVPTPVYTAQSQVKISRSSTVAGLMTDVVAYSSYDNMATQQLVIKSRPVLERVASRLKLVKPGEDPDPVYDDLRGRLNTEQVNASDVLAISATASSAEEAILLANTAVAAYIEQYDTNRDKAIVDTHDFISRRYNDVTSDLNDAQKELYDFKRDEGGKIQSGANMGAELIEKETQYNRTLNDTIAYQASIARIRETRDYDLFLQNIFPLEDAFARQMNDDAIRAATIWSDWRNKRNDLLKYQVEGAPQVLDAEGQMKLNEQRVTVRLDALSARLKQDVADTQRVLAANLEQQKILREQPELVTRLDDLTAEVKEKSELAAEARKKLSDVEIQQKEKTEEVTVVETAHSASTIPQPQRTYRAMVGALIGILIGGVFAFILEAMDTSLGTIEDVEQHIESTVLGIIPHLEKEDVKDRMKLERGPTLSPEELDRFSRLVTHFDPKSIGSEAYRTLRTNIASIMAKTNAKVIMVTSSMIQEGKTTSCCNLAVAFAQSGKRTLLIDADLRRPNCDKAFGIVRVPGVTDLLLDTRDSQECYRTVDDIMLGKFGLKLTQTTPGLEYLTILPAGRIVDKPTELLATPGFDKLLEDARQKFDVILVDVSPILPVADAFVLAPKVDGVILAYQIGRVARDVLKRSKIRVESVGGKVFGVILNDIQSEIDYRSGDFSYYHYRYDRDLDQPKTLMERLKAPMRLPSSKTPKQAKPPNRRTSTVDSPAPAASKRSSGSKEVNDVMSLTDDKKD